MSEYILCIYMKSELYLKRKQEYEQCYAEFKRLEAGLAERKYSLFTLQKKYDGTQSECEKSILSNAGKDYKATEMDVDLALERASMAAFSMYGAW